MSALVAKPDNLGKGASGAAVQNLKLMLGLWGKLAAITFVAASAGFYLAISL